MHLLTLSLNHTTAPLALRERVAFSAERMRDALGDLRRRLSGLIPESAILSTCNRTELYCAVHEPDAAHSALIDWLANGRARLRGNLRAHLQMLPQHDAVRHAFRVASGLESMVIGEPQILGQMKNAARQAQEAGALGTHLHQLFQRSFAVAKEVRTQTEIGAASVSMAAAAVRLAQRSFEGDLRKARVLLIGAGEMIELAAIHFAAQHPHALVIANRTLERAERLARRLGARPMRLAELPKQLEHFDIVVSCTASALPIMGLGMVERASLARNGKPIVMVDLAVPRDIEPEVSRLPNVFLHTVDDLGRLVQSGVSSRHAAVAQAEGIIETRVESFMDWMAARRAVPLVRVLNERAELLRVTELKRAHRRLARGETVESVLGALATGLSNKLLHMPRSLIARGSLPPDEARRLVDQWLGQVGSGSEGEKAISRQRQARIREKAAA